jgi:hypothetical protein
MVTRKPPRHCEERSDEAIQTFTAALDCFAPLAMTNGRKNGRKIKREAERRQTRIQPSAPYGRGSVLCGARSPSAFHHGSDAKASAVARDFRPGFLGRGKSADL